MIGISKLYCGTVERSDVLRYNRSSQSLPSRLLQFSEDKKPIVVWNCTRRCNLRCAHCYSCSTDAADAHELSAAEAMGLIDDLAAFGAPVLLFSGGEPLLRPDVEELIAAASRTMRTVLSTNGTLLSAQRAGQLARTGIGYVGVSLDGLEAANDDFRGVRGAFAAAVEGIRNSLAAGLKVGLRLTMTRRNVSQIPAIFDLVEREGIQRVCFYHLVSAGRGGGLIDDRLTHPQTRQALDRIMNLTADLHARGRPVEVLTVDNHADAPYVYLRLLRENPQRAAQCLELMRLNGGNSSGIGIGCVSWNGDVHPDQFWRDQVVGNIRQTPFSRIWGDGRGALLQSLRNRKSLLAGRCARCRWLDICNGNFRARAAAAGNLWGDDPACYLTDDEIKP